MFSKKSSKLVEVVFVAYILMAFSFVFSMPETFIIYKINSMETPPIIDGDLSDWNENYKIKTAITENNVYQIVSMPLDAKDWNADYYCAWDDKWMYFGIRVTADDKIVRGNNDLSDCVYIIPTVLDHGKWIYLFNNVLGYGNPSFCAGNPININTFSCGVNMYGNGVFPTYEFKMDMPVLRSCAPGNGIDSLKIMVGTIDDESDSGWGPDLGFGVEYLGQKYYYESQCYYPWTYPTYKLVGEYISIQKNKLNNRKPSFIELLPNPCFKGTPLNVRCVSKPLRVQIYDINGRLIQDYSSIGNLSFQMDLSDLSSGLYLLIVYLINGNFQKKLLLY
jgi:hypothetical protein